MRLIAHISDLHFGHEDRRVAEALLDELTALSPALIAISGDLTQRAKRSEFMAARTYLRRLNAPYLVVPGNHDIPLYNLVHRFAQPLNLYQEYITRDLNPFFLDEEIAVMGINSARSLTIKNGRISPEQLTQLKAKLCTIDNKIFKILVTHHQFIPPPGKKPRNLIGGALPALKDLELGGVDLLLAGHLHLGYTGDIRTHHPLTNRSMIVAQAGTAISTRHRGETNSYNLISIQADTVTISLRLWNGKNFQQRLATEYHKLEGQWQAIPTNKPSTLNKF